MFTLVDVKPSCRLGGRGDQGKTGLDLPDGTFSSSIFNCPSFLFTGLSAMAIGNTIVVGILLN